MTVDQASYKLLINGKLVDGLNPPFAVINPATGEAMPILAPHATEVQVDAAVDAAKRAFKDWSSLSLDERKAVIVRAHAVLVAHEEEIADLLCAEQGKPLKNARSEVRSALNALKNVEHAEIPVKHVAQDNRHSFEIHRKSIGVVAAIIPWNYPVYIAAMKIAHALVFGNTLVLKPSPNTPLATLRIAELIASVLPSGTLNVLAGPDTRDETCVGEILARHPDIALVSFTGSIPTGKRVYGNCARKMARVLLELGGNDPAVVLPGADIDEAATGILEGSLINNGQICCGIKRVFVHESQFSDFSKKLAKLANEKIISIGNGTEKHVTLGPLNNETQFMRVSHLVEDAVKNGDTCIAGGKRPAHVNQKGFFYEPTVLVNVKEGMRIVDEEQFGPVIPLMSYQTVEEAISRANNTNYGLGASVWGSHAEEVNRVALRLEAGTVWTNEHAGDSPGLPFGGFKDSGIGREGGDYDLLTYTECQSVKLLK